jgi:hypothetical protein
MSVRAKESRIRLANLLVEGRCLIGLHRPVLGAIAVSFRNDRFIRIPSSKLAIVCWMSSGDLPCNSMIRIRYSRPIGQLVAVFYFRQPSAGFIFLVSAFCPSMSNKIDVLGMESSEGAYRLDHAVQLLYLGRGLCFGIAQESTDLD